MQDEFATSDLKQKTVEINGKSYLINKWTTSQQIHNLPIIGKILTPLVTLFKEEVDENGGNVAPQHAGLNSEDLANAVYAMLEQIEGKGTLSVFELIVSNVYGPDRNKVTIDTFEDIEELLCVSVEVIKYNYGKVLSGKGFMGFLSSAGAVSQFTQS